MRSYYELTTPLSTVKKSHLVEWFTGDGTLSRRWTLTNVTGTGNAVTNSYGVSYWTGAGGTDLVTLNFNDVRHFSHTGSVVIWIGQVEATAQGGFGMGAGKSTFWINAIKTVTSTSGYLMLYSGDASTESGTNTNIPYTETHTPAWNTHKLEQKNGSSELTVNGMLEATKTTNQPTTRMQPMAYCRLASKTNSVRYCEAWNT